MTKTKAYEDLALMPGVMAYVVATSPYEGTEVSGGHKESFVRRIEAERQSMTDDDIDAFAAEVNELCRAAYEARAKWFMKIIRSGDRGRDELLNVWIPHWLSAYLGRRARIYA